MQLANGLHEPFATRQCGREKVQVLGAYVHRQPGPEQIEIEVDRDGVARVDRGKDPFEKTVEGVVVAFEYVFEIRIQVERLSSLLAKRSVRNRSSQE